MEPIDLIDLYRRIVGFDTTSKNSNLEAMDFIADYCSSAGASVDRFANESGDKVNLVVHLGPKVEGGLILSGHIDVVPAADQPGWETDPFVLTELDDRFVGRGSVDMKGFDTLAVDALVGFRDRKLSRPLVLILTYDEELGTVGAQDFCSQWDNRYALPTQAIIGEPTSLRAVRMHKGHLKARIDIPGKAAHSGYPGLGDNAIEKAGRVIHALTEFGRQLQEERADTSQFFPEYPYPILNMAMIEGGAAANIVPDRCRLTIGLRILPGHLQDEFVQRLEGCVKQAEPQASIDVYNASPPLLCPDSAEVYRAVCDLIGQKETVGVSYATDGGPLSTMNLECVIFGPGSIDCAHQPNEFMPKDEFIKARGMLDRIIEQFCL
jgi:acetylornithine deacetylase